jgi:aryl-alcohol dehydrogenase-like predicted oxidoreductase
MGYGAMQLRHCPDAATARAVLSRAIELGVDHIDTAQFYGDGFVNGVIRDVVGSSDAIVVATKVGADPNPGGAMPIRPAQRPEQLRASVNDNLKSLGVERLDLVNLRRLDVAPGLSAEGDQMVDIDDQLAVLIALRDEGKIGAIGLSAVDLSGLTRALPARIACVQNAYSVLSRRYEDMLALCVAQGVAWVPFFPLGGAHFPEWPKVTDHPTVAAIAGRLGVTSSQLGLAWLLAHEANVLLIPGTSSQVHLEENVASASLRLSDDVMTELDATGADTMPFNERTSR